METESERIGKILRDAFDAALKERNTASDAFDENLREIPSGLPHPDGVQRIKKWLWGIVSRSGENDCSHDPAPRIRESWNCPG
jgi:hypothetical protein